MEIMEVHLWSDMPTSIYLKTYVRDKESDYAECDLWFRIWRTNDSDHNPSSSEEIHSFGEGSNISDNIFLSSLELCLRWRIVVRVTYLRVQVWSLQICFILCGKCKLANTKDKR